MRRVAWDLPEGFDNLEWINLQGQEEERTWPFPETYGRSLTISPYLSGEFLEWLLEVRGQHFLVSRLETLQSLNQSTLKKFKQTWVLDDQAAGEPEEPVEEAVDSDEHKPLPLTNNEFPEFGLHAKLFVFEGQRAHLFTGSANATNAAFSTNVEFMAGMEGPKSHCGIDAVLGWYREGVTLSSMLTRYQPGEQIIDDLEELKLKLEGVRRQLSEAAYVGRVEESEGRFDVALSSAKPPSRLPKNVSITCWPVTLQQAQGEVTLLSGKDTLQFSGLSFEALTPFFAFEVIGKEGDRTSSVRFVLNIPLEGLPKDRESRILKALLQNRDRVLRLLLMLLASDAEDPGSLTGTASMTGDGEDSLTADHAALFEPLVLALGRDPNKLSAVNRLVTDLQSDPNTKDLLPSGLSEFLAKIWKAKESIGATDDS